MKCHSWPPQKQAWNCLFNCIYLFLTRGYMLEPSAFCACISVSFWIRFTLFVLYFCQKITRFCLNKINLDSGKMYWSICAWARDLQFGQTFSTLCVWARCKQREAVFYFHTNALMDDMVRLFSLFVHTDSGWIGGNAENVPCHSFSCEPSLTCCYWTVHLSLSSFQSSNILQYSCVSYLETTNKYVHDMKYKCIRNNIGLI